MTWTRVCLSPDLTSNAVPKDGDEGAAKGSGPWQQRLQQDAAVLQWKRAQDEKILQEQESRWRSEEARQAEDLDAVELDNARGEGAAPAEDAVKNKEGPVKEEATSTAAPATPATPSTPVFRSRGDGKKIRGLLTELQDVMKVGSVIKLKIKRNVYAVRGDTGGRQFVVSRSLSEISSEIA